MILYLIYFNDIIFNIFNMLIYTIIYYVMLIGV